MKQKIRKKIKFFIQKWGDSKLEKKMYLTTAVMAGSCVISPGLVEVLDSNYNGSYYVVFINGQTHFILKRYFTEPLPVLMELF